MTWAPPTAPVQQPTSMARRPKFWAAIAATAFLTGSCGLAAGSPSDTSGTRNIKTPTKTEPSATVTATVTATPDNKPAPRPTVTKTITATATVTKDAVDHDDSSMGGSGNEDAEAYAYYPNCAAARSAGAAPVHRGEPGYGRHLDRDGDGIGCDS